MTAASMSNEDLARRCADETDKFNRRQPHDPQFCFELLRRALAQGVNEALDSVYHIYERQVLAWVYNHSRFMQTGESADFFARTALSTFYFALRGDKFERFPSLPQVLKYLKLCVHTAIMQYLRDQLPASTGSIEDAGEIAHTDDLSSGIDATELWSHITRVLADERDQLLARCTFVLDLKPRQIVEAYPKVWANERAVSVALYRIRRTLRNDPQLQNWFRE